MLVTKGSGDAPVVEVEAGGKTLRYSPEEISAMVRTLDSSATTP
jgi:hypothetical protein